MLVAFDSNVLTAFLDSNGTTDAASGEALASFRLFLYAQDLTILPTVTAEAWRIPSEAKREEHLRWVWYSFPEAQLDHLSAQVTARAEQLVPLHPERDIDDCRIVAEAEHERVDVLATIDRRIKRLQPHTSVRLLTPTAALDFLGVTPGVPPCRQPATGHPLHGANWWRI